MGLWETLQNNMKKQIRPEIEAKYPEVTDCIALDEQIKLLAVHISDTRKKSLATSNRAKEMGFDATVELMEEIKLKREELFITQNCSSRIETKKLKETADIIGSEIKKYEDDVLGSSNKDRNKLFLIGGAILLVATGLILYFNSNKK